MCISRKILTVYNVCNVQRLCAVFANELNSVQESRAPPPPTPKEKKKKPKQTTASLEPRLSVLDFVLQLWIFLKSCKTKSGTKSLGSRLNHRCFCGSPVSCFAVTKVSACIQGVLVFCATGSLHFETYPSACILFSTQSKG